MADEEPNMPKNAQRRAGADTLFSAEWFDDNDDFTGKKPEGLRESASVPSTSPSKAAKAPQEKKGVPVVAIVVVLATLMLLAGCGLGAIAGVLAYMYGVV